jgi:hypothetical protein
VGLSANDNHRAEAYTSPTRAIGSSKGSGYAKIKSDQRE